MATFFQEELQRQVDARGEIVRWGMLLGVATAALMEVIDTSITNVALPHIQGNLGATTSEAAWVVTSYGIANVITMPLAVLLGDLFGKKSYFIFSMIGFTVASAVCGMADSLTTLVIARVMQGLFGGGLLAKAQAFLFEGFPPEKQGMVQGIFGICVLVGPVLGPTLGGWLTDNYNWRWIFYINIPVGILSTIICQSYLPKDDPSKKNAPKPVIDWPGIAFLSIMLGCFQYVLEKGQDEDWFSSRIIVTCSILAAVGFVAFIWREFTTRYPAVNLRILRYKSVAVGLFFQGVVGFVMFGVNYVIPNFAQLMLGYTALQAGMLQIPSSLITSAMFPIVGAMAGKVDARLMVGIGIAFLALSNMVLLPITLNWGWDQFLTTSLFRGFGVVLVFLPLTLAAVGDCDTEDIQTASSLLSLVRTLGGSVGIALLATLLTRREDFHRAVLVEHVTPFNTLATERLQNFIGMFQSKGFSIPDARERALHLLSQQVDTQAIVLAFSDIAWILMTFTALTLPFCFLLTSGKRGGKVEMH
ncbi:MAG: DHA2 family efflux MFS transporter permease subunit [Candidatus Melainabacteria bacterium]|jgi:DHA2 family multidrug resistance protein|nr:DHA2 family efflux MFS transporter permease subunit [Candidatus Melainabacteria bacterium]MBX9674237.1 DHA2 family efflux MFS transporter permease subunit [Candidatus Obscuribacterales bacterium]